MSNEEHSPGLLVAQKSVTENKQTTSIRKITIQSITPVIEKVEQHIAYLTQQTTQLRNQNSNLIAAQANQKILQNQINQINSALENLQLKIETYNRDKEKKLTSHGIQFQHLAQEIRAIKTDNALQASRVDQINHNNETYLNVIEKSKQQQIEAVEVLKTSIENYYEQELIKIGRVNEEAESLQGKIAILQEKRYYDQEQVKRLANIVELYQSERDEMKRLFQRTSFLQSNVVMAQQHQKDKKMTNIHMELVKSDIRKMLDEALTPDIRRFLPVLIKKLDELNAFESKLQKLNNNLQNSKIQLEKQSKKVHQQLSEKLISIEKFTTANFQQVRTKMEDEIAKIQQKNCQTENLFKQKFSNIQQQVNFNKKIAQINLQQTNSKLQKDIKSYMVVWGDTFIQEKKDVFYSIMQRQRPRQKVEQQKKVFELVYQIQPLVIKVKEQLQTFTRQAKEQKKDFYQKLCLFSNQIVKLKSDLSIETSQHKKSFDYFNSKLKNSEQLQKQISLMLSKLTETSLILYALSIEKNFLDRQSQVYVTYNDGILIQIQDSVLKYRRKQYNPEILKRAVVTEIVKMIDNVIVNEPFMKWNQTQMKPSHFNTQVNHAYLKIYEENKEKILKYQNPAFSGEKKAFHQNNSKIGRSKFLSLKDTLSKTIDIESNQSKQFAMTARYENKQENPVLTANQATNFKNIRLKKLDKKE